MEVPSHTQPLPALPAIGAREDLPRRAGEHGLRTIDADRRVVNVGVAEPTGDARPALTAVTTAPHPVDLHTRPHDAVIQRVDGQRRHPRDAYVRTFFGHLGPELLPMSAAIGRAEERRRPRAGKDRLRVRRVVSDLPDVERIHRRVEMLEMLAPVLAAVDAVIGAGEDGPRLFRVG